MAEKATIQHVHNKTSASARGTSFNMDFTKLVPHELCLLVPDLSERDLNALRASLQTSENLEANRITIYDGKILDGRHRYQVAADNGVKFHVGHFEVFVGNEAEAREFVMQRLTHRHMLLPQRGATGVHLAYDHLLKKTSNKALTTDRVARQFGVGKTTVEFFLMLRKKNPWVFADVLAGNFTYISEVKRAAKLKKNEYGDIMETFEASPSPGVVPRERWFQNAWMRVIGHVSSKYLYPSGRKAMAGVFALANQCAANSDSKPLDFLTSYLELRSWAIQAEAAGNDPEPLLKEAERIRKEFTDAILNNDAGKMNLNAMVKRRKKLEADRA